LKLSFQRVVIHPNRTPNKRVTPFLLCWCKLSQTDFRMCDAQRFGCNFLHRSPKMLILDALESRLNGALEYPIFPSCTWRIRWRLERGEWIGACKNSSQRTRPIP
jgi:hypothetical protein